MAYQEFIESLRKSADQKLEAIRDEAKQEAERIRAETGQKIDQLRKARTEQQSLELRAKVAEILADADRNVRVLELAMQEALSNRLYSLARASLKRLRDDAYQRVFEKTAEEVPQFSWRMVRVNPEDAGLAKQFFPDAEVVPDADISGGLDVMSEDSRTRVINTFEKRLERAWTDILPGLLKDVNQEAAK